MNEDKKPVHDANENADVNPDANPDPITGQPGAHPVGTGVGAASAGAVATAVGAAIGGPVGAIVGAVAGAVGGGLIGKGVAEQVNPTVEDEYWRTNYSSRPYVEKSYDYDDYSPAYRTGYEGYSNYGAQGMSYNEAEPHMREDYARLSKKKRLEWEMAKYATRDAWDRAEQTMPQDGR